MHVPELRRLGADISLDGASAVVRGVERLGGAPVAASDLRASAALVLAGLAADNRTELSGVEHLDRGYQHLEEQLASLGARVHREASPEQANGYAHGASVPDVAAQVSADRPSLGRSVNV